VPTLCRIDAAPGVDWPLRAQPALIRSVEIRGDRLSRALHCENSTLGIDRCPIDNFPMGKCIMSALTIQSWPLPEMFDDGELERRLFTAPGEAQPERPAPAWTKLHEELKRRSVTLVPLWQE
jgi:hypothetical protein